MDVKLSISVAIIVAIVAAEVLSLIWYSDSTPWGRWGQRYWVAALVADVGLAFIIQWIIRSASFRNNNVESYHPLSVQLAVYFSVPWYYTPTDSMFFFCFESIINHKSLSHHDIEGRLKLVAVPSSCRNRQ